jgi:hypothetical protein
LTSVYADRGTDGMIRLSKHTCDEMAGRGIRLDFIEAAIAAPDYTDRDPIDPTLTRAFKAIAEFGGRMLRVVFRTAGSGEMFVVTAHWDRGAKRR